MHLATCPESLNGNPLSKLILPIFRYLAEVLQKPVPISFLYKEKKEPSSWVTQPTEV